MWLSEIFEREFGFSDVQSNYSRVYAWMANQLGHMTLGLAAALLFAWVHETFETAANLILDRDGRTRQADGACEWALSCLANNALVFVAAAAVIGAIVFVCVLIFRSADTPLSAEERKRFRPISGKARKLVAFLLAPAALLSVAHFLGFAAEVEFPLADDRARGLFDDRIARVGAAAAIFTFAAGVLYLCRDRRYAIFALLSLFGAFWIAIDGGEAPDEMRRFMSVALPVLFCGYALWSTALNNVVRAEMPRSERFAHCGVILIISVWFVFGSFHGLEGDWPRAVAAAIASCTLWWVKEFGSDLPNVYREISDAKARRPLRCLGDCGVIDDDYVRDARMDARTDGLFYFAGAWIGAGVLSETPVMTAIPDGPGAWASGSEILGLLIFLAIFIGLGRNWAFRQQALDLSGVGAASRLAVFRSALRMVVIEPGAPLALSVAPPLAYLRRPMIALRSFANDTWGSDPGGSDPGGGDPGGRRFDHLVVFGAPGAGRSPLGRAIASEAALSDLQTRLGNDAAAAADRAGGRTSRFIAAKRLRNFFRHVRRAGDVAITPPAQIAFDEKGRARPGGARGPEPSRFDAANLVVIDDVAEMDEEALTRLTGNLALSLGQQTVWLVETDRFDTAEGASSQAEIDAWRPDYRRAAAELSALRIALSANGPARRIGVGFIRRFEPAERPG